MDLDQPTEIEQADLGIGMDVDMNTGLDGDRNGDPAFHDLLGDVDMDGALEPNDVGIPLNPMTPVRIFINMFVCSHRPCHRLLKLKEVAFPLALKAVAHSLLAAENIRSPSLLSSVDKPRAPSESSFVRSFLGQDMVQEPEVVEPQADTKKPATRKPKTAKVLLDPRTELTDAELKASEAHLSYAHVWQL